MVEEPRRDAQEAVVLGSEKHREIQAVFLDGTFKDPGKT